MRKSCGFLGLLAMVVAAPLARADFIASVNGVQCASEVNVSPSGSLTCPVVTFGNVTITNLAVSGLETAAFSQQFGTTLTIANTGGAVTFTISVADSNFTTPVTPPAIDDNSSSTLNVTTGTNSMTLTSCVDQSNGLVPPGGPFCSSPAPGMAAPNPTLMQIGAGADSNTSGGVIGALHAPFSLTQELMISAGAGANFSVTSSQVLAPVPEPASIFLVLGGALLVTMVVRKRFRAVHNEA